MGHTPYGYRIENGIAVINPDEAGHVRQIFQYYIEGMSLSGAAKAAGYPMVHSMVRRMLSRECYLGDSFYPAIIDKETFVKANAEWNRRAAEMNRIGRTRKKIPQPQTKFTMGQQNFHYDDPVQQAEYLYSLIESKVT